MAINESHVIKAISELEFDVQMQDNSPYNIGYKNCLKDMKKKLGI